MTNLEFDKEITALLLIDPYNDFISEGGKLWDRIKTVAEANDCVSHMLQLLTAARETGVRVFYAMHHRYRPGDYETWKYTAPIQKAAWSRKTFEFGTWGGEFRPEFAPQLGDIVAQEHWCSSGFANTDLDLQLKRHGIQRLIVAGLVAHTCVESTVRFAVELGYDVTLVLKSGVKIDGFVRIGRKLRICTEIYAVVDQSFMELASGLQRFQLVNSMQDFLSPHHYEGRVG